MKPSKPLIHPRFFEFLATFRIAATSRNFLEASQKIGISQANLSLQLKQLETLLPHELFELRGKKKVLTHFGTDFLGVATKALMDAEDQLTTFCEGHSKEESLTLRVGCRPDFIPSFQKKIPFRGSLEFVSLSSEEVSKAIQEKKIHLGITYLPPDSLDVVAIKAFKSGRTFISHPSQKILDPMRVAKDWFQQRTAVAFKEGDLLVDFLGTAGLKLSDLKKLCRVDSWRSVIDLVVNNPNAYAVVPEYMGIHLRGLNAKTLAYEKYNPVDFFYVFLKSLKKNPVYARVISELRDGL